MTPDELLQQLKGKSNAQKRRSLDIIYGICREQFERGSKDFSIVAIGKLSEKQGGPKEQPIRNKTGEDFRALILAWARHTGGSERKPKKVIESPIHAVLMKIEDPAVRAVMGSVLAENTKLKGQVNLLKRQVEMIVDKRPIELQRTSRPVEVLQPSTGLTHSEIEALTNAVSASLMESEGWTVDGNGRVKNAKGRVLYKPGYVTAIKKVLAVEEKNG